MLNIEDGMRDPFTEYSYLLDMTSLGVHSQLVRSSYGHTLGNPSTTQRTLPPKAVLHPTSRQ